MSDQEPTTQLLTEEPPTTAHVTGPDCPACPDFQTWVGIHDVVRADLGLRTSLDVLLEDPR